MTALELSYKALAFSDYACVGCLLLVVIPVLMGILQANLKFDFRIPLLLVILFFLVAVTPIFSVFIGGSYDDAYQVLSWLFLPIWILVIVHYCRLINYVWLSIDCFSSRGKLTFIVGLILLPVAWGFRHIVYFIADIMLDAPEETWPMLAFEVMWSRILFAVSLSLVIYMITWMLYCKWQPKNST